MGGGMFHGEKRYEVKQHDSTDCAAACLVSICSYYGRHLPLIEVRDICGTNENGATMQGIVSAAERLGLEAKPLRASEKQWNMFSILDSPAIIHLRRTDGWLHFVVLYGWHRNYVSVMDPAEGRIVKVEQSVFMEEWSGYLVVLSPSDSFLKEDKTTDLRVHYRKILHFCREDLIFAFAGAVVYVVTGLSSSLFIQQIVDVAIPDRNVRMLSIFAAAMVIAALASFVTGYLRTLFTVRAGLKTDSMLVMVYVRKLLSLPVTFFSTRSTGELTSRIKDVYRVRNFLTVRLLVICICVLTLMLSFVLMFTFCWKLALVVVIYIPLYAALYKISDTVNRKMNRRIIEAGAAFDSESVEAIAGVRTIKYLGWQKLFERKIEDRYLTYMRESWQGSKYVAGFTVTSDTLARFLSYAVLVLGTIYVFSGGLTIGELVSFYTVTSFFTSPVNSLIESNNDIAQASVAAGRLFEILDLQSEELDPDAGILPPEGNRMPLKVEDLSFSYTGTPTLFENLSFEIHPGTVTAITGANGSGKSTLAMLLMRGCEPSSGRILLGNTDIRNFSLSGWRKYVSIVPQKAELFRGSIIENVAPDGDSPDAERIASLCVAADFDISLQKFPDGILSQVGEGGCRLSGGERQKVALVRALYRDFRILILDEATASVDKESRERVLALIKSLAAQGKTIIMITHDDFFLTAADRIVLVGQQ